MLYSLLNKKGPARFRWGLFLYQNYFFTFLQINKGLHGEI